jgi:hypothetical protein
MPTKLTIFFLFLLVSCGKDVKFTDHLSEKSALAQPLAITQQATIVKSSSPPPGKIIMGGRTYSISPFSSYVALKFINEQQENAQVPVRISGEVKGSEVYIKIIEQ